MNSFKNKREEGNLTFTGFRPTGRIHLGNLSTLLELISDKEVLFMIADLHGMVSGYGSQKKGNLMVRTIVGIFEFYNKSN